MSTKRLTAQRMSTNADWSNVFKFVVGLPPIPQNLSTWTIVGTVCRDNMSTLSLPLFVGTRLALGVDTSQLIVSLTALDTKFLGAGKVVFEILRTSPPPQRPILKFYIENHLGVYADDS